MAKKSNTTVTVEVDPSNLGVLSRHHVLMQTDQDYRDRALTPPGGKPPGEGDKRPEPVPDNPSIPAGAVQAALANQ